MSTSDRTLWITYNGEIYNFRELRRELELRGVAFRTTSDTEVLLELYRAEGTRFLSKLRGMFAFALWDASKRCLLLARDPFGIKPLYFADDGRTFRFASQVKALLASPSIDTKPSPSGQVGFFLWGHIPEPHTIYRSIQSLRPGHAMTVSHGGPIKTWLYRDPLDCLAKEPLDGPNPADKAMPRDELAHALEESVGYHMIADVPVGCFLSSGIDSNVLCALALQASLGKQLECITLGFEEYDGTADDEVPLAIESARRFGVAHHVRRMAKSEFEAEIERLFECMDQPSVDGVNTYFVAKIAAESGLKVALSGVGGDELFGGYPSFSQVPRLVAACKWLPLGSSIGAAIRHVAAPIVKRVSSPKYASLLEFGQSFGGAFFLRRGLFMPWELSDFLDPDLVNEGLQQLQVPSALDERLSSIRTPYERVMAAEILDYLQPRLLRDADWAGMAHSLEIRTPYVDAFLFQRVASLLNRPPAPPSKRDLAACSPIPLVASLIKREKTGFTVPVRRWLPARSDGPDRTRGLRSWAALVAKRFSFEFNDTRAGKELASVS